MAKNKVKNMWEYKKEVIRIEKDSSIDITKEMNKLGAEGWEIFSITKTIEKIYAGQGDTILNPYYIDITKVYELHAKRPITKV